MIPNNKSFSLISISAISPPNLRVQAGSVLDTVITFPSASCPAISCTQIDRKGCSSPRKRSTVVLLHAWRFRYELNGDVLAIFQAAHRVFHRVCQVFRLSHFPIRFYIPKFVSPRTLTSPTIGLMVFRKLPP